MTDSFILASVLGGLTHACSARIRIVNPSAINGPP